MLLEEITSRLNANAVSEERKRILQPLIDYLRETEKPILNFICTHNSRRSQMSQIWAQAAAHHYNIQLRTFSGGTEATAFHPNAVAAIKRAGFSVTNDTGDNPTYKVQFSPDEAPLDCFSKKFDDSFNPQNAFAAVMTCSEADADCPLILGADQRIKLLYDDPKVSDGTVNEQKIYDERCHQIASEMFYVFSSVKE